MSLPSASCFAGVEKVMLLRDNVAHASIQQDKPRVECFLCRCLVLVCKLHLIGTASELYLDGYLV